MSCAGKHRPSTGFLAGLNGTLDQRAEAGAICSTRRRATAASLKFLGDLLKINRRVRKLLSSPLYFIGFHAFLQSLNHALAMFNLLFCLAFARHQHVFSLSLSFLKSTKFLRSLASLLVYLERERERAWQRERTSVSQCESHC